MKYKVKCKQVVSNNCFICGEKNKKGLKTSFYLLENGEIAAVFTPDEDYNSYPNYMHGGISAAVLDETMGRAGQPEANPSILAVTMELKIRYKKPVPLGKKLICIGRKVEENSRGYIGTGELYAPDGTVLVTAEGKFFNIDPTKMFSGDDDFLYISQTHPDLDYIEIPDKN